MSEEVKLKPEELVRIDYRPPKKSWMDPTIDFQAKKGNWCYSGALDSLKYLDLPHPKTKWAATDEDWQLPENWKEIILEGLRKRLDRFRTLRLSHPADLHGHLRALRSLRG